MKDIDSCRIKVYYDVKFVKDTADRASVCKDLQRLDIGYNYTYCYSRLLHINDSLRTIAYEKDENYPSKLDENDVLPEEILTNTKTKTLNVRRRMYYNYTNLCYNETAPKIEWKLENGSKTIIDYLCKRHRARSADVNTRHGTHPTFPYIAVRISLPACPDSSCR